MKIKKKVLAALTALSLAATCCLMMAMAPAAFAEDTSGLQDLINSAAEGSTITLSADYSITDNITIDKALTINGAGHSITAPDGVDVFNVTSGGVTLQNLTINASGSGYGINATGANLTVTGCTINAVARGISFYPVNGSGATLNVSETVIKNTTVSNYDMTANYSGDNRGIATSNVLGGAVTISDSSILGFKYSINAVVSPESSADVSLRDGEGTCFNISGSTIKGWTVLNIWSAATTFTFTDCTLVGISTLSGDSNNYSTISANDGIYGGNTDKSSTVKFVGGSVTAAKLGTVAQSVLNVDVELQTKYIFEQFYNEDEEVNENVVVSYYGSENTADSQSRQVLMWNFYPTTTEAAAQNYLDTMVSGDETNVTLVGGTVDEYTTGIVSYGINDIEVKNGKAFNVIGGKE